MPKGKRTVSKPTCGQCGGLLLPGVAHICPMQPKVVTSGAVMGVDWKWWVAFIFQFIVLIGTMLWKGGSLTRDLQYLKDEQAKEDQRLQRIERYFTRPLPPEDK
jgi:hypothetical protein